METHRHLQIVAVLFCVPDWPVHPSPCQLCMRKVVEDGGQRSEGNRSNFYHSQKQRASVGGGSMWVPAPSIVSNACGGVVEGNNMICAVGSPRHHCSYFVLLDHVDSVAYSRPPPRWSMGRRQGRSRRRGGDRRQQDNNLVCGARCMIMAVPKNTSSDMQ